MTKIAEHHARSLGITWFDYQEDTFQGWIGQLDSKACLFYKTGAGKTSTSLTMMSLRGEKDVLVVTPPSTFDAWREQARKLGMRVDTISHAKFRMKSYKLSRTRAVIVDEFHMLGGHGGQGWKKLDSLGRNLQAPLVIMSATPNYNDAERVYCVAHVLAPHLHKGGYIEWLYRHCITEQNPFGMEPIVTGFHRFPDAATFMASMPGVYYLPDDLVFQIQDVPYLELLPDEIETHGYNRRDHRLIASAIERKHTERQQGLIGDDDLIHPRVMKEVDRLVQEANGPVLIFSNHATVALALAGTMRGAKQYSIGLVTGGMTTKAKAEEIAAFRRRKFEVLIGTASLATGTDGLDKMCNTLIILDDTDDDSLRRQLIGRIMPRGADTDASMKRVFRFLPM